MKYAIWLQAVLLEGNNKLLKILEYFKSAEGVYFASDEKLKASRLFSDGELKRAMDKNLKFAEEVIKLSGENGIKIITFFDFLYPNTLRNIPNPPLVLYIKGRLPDFDTTPTITIVGPRRVSDFGEKSAYSLAHRLSRAGITVVSGGAYGGDTAAHIGAIKAGGNTVAILPCGILSSYLKENENLRQKIAQTGCLISEYPPKKPVLRSSFTVRNRLLAAISHSTVVVEAGEKSGTLITANYACEYGKELFVIPGNPTYPHYKGSNTLLRDGAKPLLSASDIFNEYLPHFAEKIDLENAFKQNKKTKTDKKEIKNLPLSLSKEAKMVYNQLDKLKFSADDLLSLGISDDELISAITELEMEHLIKAIPGGMYEKL